MRRTKVKTFLTSQFFTCLLLALFFIGAGYYYGNDHAYLFYIIAGVWVILLPSASTKY